MMTIVGDKDEIVAMRSSIFLYYSGYGTNLLGIVEHVSTALPPYLRIIPVVQLPITPSNRTICFQLIPTEKVEWISPKYISETFKYNGMTPLVIIQ